MLVEAARVVFPDTADPRRQKYEDAATHQEIRRGALEAADAANHVHCYFRHIEGMPEDERARDYRDIKDGSADTEAQNRLLALKAQLASIFPVPEEHIYSYTASWNNGNPRSDLAALCGCVERDLRAIIGAELAAFEEKPELDREIEAHEEFGCERREHFMGREDVLEKIGNHLAGRDNRPLVVYGVAGSGKTAVMAEAAERLANERGSGTTILTRFIGATPASSEIRSLLGGLCRQMARIDNDPRPVPEELPEHAKLIVSVLEAEGPEGDCGRMAQRRLPGATRVEVIRLARDEGDALLRTWWNAHTEPYSCNSAKRC